MNAGEWYPLDQHVAYRWDLAEINRMQRPDDEARALQRRLARQRVRFILRRLAGRALILALLATTAHAETCKAPNVARVLLDGYDSAGEVRCPQDGFCYRPHPVARTQILCLTPAEHAAALERTQ